MKIEFPGNFAPDNNTFGGRFEAVVDGQSRSCQVSSEALQDIDPEMALAPIREQFNAHRYVLEQIARKKIEAGENPVVITTSDLK